MGKRLIDAQLRLSPLKRKELRECGCRSLGSTEDWSRLSCRSRSRPFPACVAHSHRIVAPKRVHKTFSVDVRGWEGARPYTVM